VTDFVAHTSQRTAASGNGASVSIIELHGQLNGTATAAMERAYDEATATATSALILDFSGVDYINSTGIALVVGLLAVGIVLHGLLWLHLHHRRGPVMPPPAADGEPPPTP
jgi:hypothetical protein